QLRLRRAVPARLDGGHGHLQLVASPRAKGQANRAGPGLQSARDECIAVEMAKAIQVEGLEPGMPLEEAAAKLVPPLLGDAFARELAVRSGDPELGIHDMRVAMKRLREMFRLLKPAYPKK